MGVPKSIDNDILLIDKTFGWVSGRLGGWAGGWVGGWVALLRVCACLAGKGQAAGCALPPASALLHLHPPPLPCTCQYLLPCPLTPHAIPPRCRFDTAVEEAQRALLAAKVEASSAYRGIGLVKLMGRQSGFIAMQASMASGVVDIVSSGSWKLLRCLPVPLPDVWLLARSALPAR